MQSTGQASTHAVSLVPMQGSAITYAIEISPNKCAENAACRRDEFLGKEEFYQRRFIFTTGRSLP